ncbi:unnamed protein product [Plutella xylostella]|uniref:(diamondback moth) hypothetical protein n=1 Tax=Plutella xylostella TaxID=51655 RepID=A0A8S4FGK8_PLUXY|nr:unnamed protein product [Plutella xylostella]
MARALTLLLAALAAAAAQDDDFGFHISDAEYYTMPKLFALDEYRGCVARGLGYCVGSFDLSPRGAEAGHMFQLMQRYSANWVDRFNHTRLHRGVCLARRCPRPAAAGGRLEDWFADCVNATTMAEYNMSATLTTLEYCRGGEGAGDEGGAGEEHRAPLGASERAAAALAAALLALAAVSTTLDLTLPDHNRKGMEWALSWSVVGCWRALLATPPVSKESDLRMFDGVRVICMFCVIIEHVCWLATLSYSSDPRYTEEKRRETDVMLMTNSTLVVQIFFMMSTFLLAHKLLRARRRAALPLWGTFSQTMLNRIIRISPTYWAVVWFAASWWARLGSGPLWTPLVGAEAAVCRHKWWTHLLYLNNVVYPDDKCLIQTWYLAADMQVYVLCLALTLVLTRGSWGPRRALPLLAGCLALSLAVLAALAYAWRLVPTFVMHRPECIRRAYHGEASFNVLYQSPLGNVPGALAGLVLAHTHHLLLDRGFKAEEHPWFRWSSLAAFPLAVLWAALSPRLLGAGPPPRAAAAALAVLERPVFALGMGVAMLGALHGVRSPWRSGLSWAGWAPLARLSFAALLLHMPINKSVVASRLQPKQLDRFTAVFEWCGVAAISYLAAVPLALLVEIPAQRLHAALTRARAAPRVQPETNNNTVEKTPHT